MMATPTGETPALHDAGTDDRQTELHVVAHTHWDREWYHTAERFRQRLVALVDSLLDDESLLPFLLDGQAIVVEDYLSVRPDRRDDLTSLMQAGAIEAGPWYVLADNLIPSGEAIVRNLQAGRRILDRLGATPPGVAYCPDSFGHPAAMPLIAAEFGLELAIVWRGFGGSAHPGTDTFHWESPSGARVLAWHLPRDGYEFGSALPTEVRGVADRVARIVRELVSRSATGTVLLPNGADHHALQADLEHAIALLNQSPASKQHALTFRRSTLSEFASSLNNAARTANVPVVSGELRDSYGYTWTLQGTLGTRAADKRRNATLERLLLHDVEPWCALATLRSGEHRASLGTIGVGQLQPLLAHAWETLLRTHPHDTLCGCSIDDVAFAMRGRQRSVRSQGTGLRAEALALLVNHDAVQARTRDVDRSAFAPVVVRNRAARARSGLARIRLIETVADVRVGPGSAPASTASVRVPLPPAIRGFPTQLLSSRTEHLRRESPQHYPDNDLVRVHDMLAYLPEVPALGLRVVSPTEQSSSAAPRNPVFLESVDDSLVLQNGLARITVSMRGVTLTVGDRTLDNVLALESTRDVGDSYTPSLRGIPVALELTGIRRGAVGPLRGSIELRYSHPDGGVRARVTMSLDADASHVRLKVRGDNRRLDHRLRLHVRTGVQLGVVHADAAFGPVRRERVVAPPETQSMETPPPTMPLHRWVSVCDDLHGTVLISDGLTETEAGNDFIAVTLLRAIDELSRNDLPERPGHAGWPAHIPDAQSIGSFNARFALMFTEAWSASTIDAIERVADDVLLPLTGETWRDLVVQTQTMEGPEVVGTAFRCQSFMPAQDGSGSVVRIVNLAETEGQGTLRLPNGALEYCEASLDETPTSEWSPAGSSIQLRMQPRAVLTLRLRAHR